MCGIFETRILVVPQILSLPDGMWQMRPAPHHTPDSGIARYCLYVPSPQADMNDEYSVP